MSLDAESAAILAAKRGSNEAFARLVGLHQQAVRAFLRRLAGHHGDADDLAQEAFLTAWTRIGAFRDGQSFRSWLMGVAYRKWLTDRRGRTRLRTRETEAWRDGPKVSSENLDARLDAATILQALPAEQRAAVALCLAGGFSHVEAADSLGLPLGTVKSHVSRGRAKLLELMGGADE